MNRVEYWFVADNVKTSNIHKNAFQRNYKKV